MNVNVRCDLNWDGLVRPVTMNLSNNVASSKSIKSQVNILKTSWIGKSEPVFDVEVPDRARAHVQAIRGLYLMRDIWQHQNTDMQTGCDHQYQMYLAPILGWYLTYLDNIWRLHQIIFFLFDATPNTFFLKMGQSRPLFRLLSPFSHHNSITNSVDGVLGIQIQGHRMVGADETMELWRPPTPNTFTINEVVFLNCLLNNFNL